MPESILEGIRVADFSQIWAGPYATLLLSFMGAEVIKIESDKRPDPSRLRSVTMNRRFEGKDDVVVQGKCQGLMFSDFVSRVNGTPL